MLIPGSRDLHVDQLLTNVSIGYRNLAYIADEIFPRVEVKNQTGNIPRFKKSYWFRDEAKLRAPGTRSEGGSWDIDSTLPYNCPRWSFRDELPDEVVDNADSIYGVEERSVNFVTDKLQMRRERAWASAFFTTGQWATDEVGGVNFTLWSDYGAASPLIDTTGYMDDMEVDIGTEPNVLIVGKQVWNILKWHPDLIETVKYVQRGVMTEALVAELLGIDRLLIGRSLYTTDPEGTAEGSVTYLRSWGKNALFLYVPASPSIMTPAAGYTIVWNRVPNAIQYMKRMRDEEREIDIIEGNSYFTHVKTSAEAGIFLSGAVA